MVEDNELVTREKLNDDYSDEYPFRNLVSFYSRRILHCSIALIISVDLLNLLTFWEKRVTICKERIPTFLEKVSDMILRTGKYLNVIRQCGKHCCAFLKDHFILGGILYTEISLSGQDVNFPDAEAIVYTLNEREYVEKIEKSYHFSSKKLLDLLLQEKDLLGRLKQVLLHWQFDIILSC